MIGFFRNGFVSLAAILIMTITLFVLAALLVANAALSATLASITEKVDVNVYFTTDAPEERIMEVRAALESLPQVQEVTYVSREEALADFRERHADDELTIQALEELEENPLGASLAIRANDTSQYEEIASYLETSPVVGEGEERIVEKVNYYQNQQAIERLTDIITASRNLGIAITVILGFASLMIAFNTIRLAIYTARDEIGVMRIVGASSWYVRGPFVVSGILYGFVSAAIVLLVMYPIAYWLAESSERFFGAFNTLGYYTGDFFTLFGIIMGIGILLGALSSYLAVHRYLRV
jgi:cell division transport system permease protein